MISMLTAVYLVANPVGEPTAEVQILRWTSPAECQRELEERSEASGLLVSRMPDGRQVISAYYACTVADAEFTSQDIAAVVE